VTIREVIEKAIDLLEGAEDDAPRSVSYALGDCADSLQGLLDEGPDLTVDAAGAMRELLALLRPLRLPWAVEDCCYRLERAMAPVAEKAAWT